jgi:mRNA interferase MazF
MWRNPPLSAFIASVTYAAKTRPAVVLSIPALDEDRALVTMIMHTTSVRGTRFEVAVKAKFLREGAFECQNVTTTENSER